MRGLAILALLVVGACDVPEDPLGDDDGPDAAPPAPTIQWSYGGTYTTASILDLSHPFGGDGVGGAVADYTIDQIVALAGVPGPLEGEARELIADAIRQPIVDHVNAAIPSELVTSSPTMMALAAIFSNVQAAGTLALSAGADPDLASGTETISALHVEHEAQALDVSMAELLQGAVTVAASVSASATSADTMSTAPRDFELRVGALIAIVARDLLGVDVYQLGADAMAALSCPALVDVITEGGSSYDITVGSESFSVPASTLIDACGDLRGELADEALAMVRPDAGLRLGGPIRFAGSAGTASTVTSDPGYGGAITALSLPIEPAVTASLTATR